MLNTYLNFDELKEHEGVYPIDDIPDVFVDDILRTSDCVEVYIVIQSVEVANEDGSFVECIVREF